VENDGSPPRSSVGVSYGAIFSLERVQIVQGEAESAAFEVRSPSRMATIGFER
jgi:hypothetical protein